MLWEHSEGCRVIFGQKISSEKLAHTQIVRLKQSVSMCAGAGGVNTTRIALPLCVGVWGPQQRS